MLMSSLVALPLLGAAQALNCTGKPRTSAELRQLWMSASYDKFTRPGIALWAEEDAAGSGENESAAPPDKIYFLLQLNTLMSVDSKSQTFDVELWLRSMWFDPRLAHDSSCIQEPGASFDGSELNNLWTPSTYTSSLAGVGATAESKFWVYGSGFIWWTRKVFWKLKCPMDFASMPYDTQTCSITFSDMQYPASQLQYFYPDGSDVFYGINSSVNHVCATPEVAGGTIEWMVTYLGGTRSVAGLQSTNAMANLVYELRFTRQPQYYISYVVFPVMIVIIITWASFFISRSAVPARVAMVIIAFLALSGIITSILMSLPRLSGEVWLLSLLRVSQIFVFLATIEFALANFLGRVEARIEKAFEAAKKRRVDNASTLSPPNKPLDDATLTNTVRAGLGPVARCLLSKQGKILVRDQHLDIACRYVYPIAYILITISLFARVPEQPEQDPSLIAACP